MAGHLGGDMGHQASDRFAQQLFQLPPGVLYFVKDTLDPGTHAMEPRIEAGRSGLPLIHAVGYEEVQALSFPIPSLPVLPNEAFVPDNVGLPETIQYLVRGDPLIRGSRHQT